MKLLVKNETVKDSMECSRMYGARFKALEL